jgi:hypothetical protein
MSQPASPDQPISIWFIFGISGAGKSHFCEWLQAAKGWLHLEIDLHPKDGIDEHGLRGEWNAFFNQREPKGLIDILRARGTQVGSTGVVLSFPGNVISYITADHIKSCAKQVTFAFLSGDPKFCLRSFLQREQGTVRRLGQPHWEGNNKPLFQKLKEPAVRGYVVDAFNANGSRKSTDALYAEITKL